MTGVIKIKTLKKKAGYYQVSDYNKKVGGKFTFFIEPLQGTEDKFFYYVKELENGKYELQGEGYIVTDSDSLKRHKREAILSLRGTTPAYYWLDENDKVINKTYM